MRRRELLAWATAAVAVPARAAVSSPQSTRLAAAWEGGAGYRVGLLSATASGAATVDIAAEVEVPTRAHGLLLEQDGSLLAVARRPGDWLLRWDAQGRALQRHWIEPLRAFNGHVLANADGRTLFTTETDLETGAGLVGVRDARTLRKRDEWPTHGIDPHELTWSPDQESLLVANGGIPTQPETGRAKRQLQRMDPSLVRLEGRSGELRGQWRLGDARLSIRHLAWNDGVLGIALQAEHDTVQEREAAPVLALFDGGTLRAAADSRHLAGYGGAIAATAAGFAVSCPRAGGAVLLARDGTRRGWLALHEACAVASTATRLWTGGRALVLASASDVEPTAPETDRRAFGLPQVPPLRLDNHWICV